MTALLHPRWPLLCVYPLFAAFFWIGYLRLVRLLFRWFMPERYDRFSEMNEICFRQNVLSGVHTLLSAMCLLAALVVDRDLLTTNRLYAHDSMLLYLDLSMSLGYFSFSLPMSVAMASEGFPYGSRLMVVHHSLVAAAQVTFLLTQYPSGYMAASGFLFEATNLFFIPHVLLLQLGAPQRLRSVVGGALVIVYTLARCVACTALAVLSVSDLRHFTPPPDVQRAGGAAGCWLAMGCGLGCFYGLLLISWYWYFTSILPSLHSGLQAVLGRHYYRACCPARLRLAVWRRFTREGRAHDEREREMRAALRALRAENEPFELESN